MHRLYRRHSLVEEPLGVGPDTCIFSSSDRVKLLLSILSAPASAGGANTDVKDLLEAQCVHAAFPLHKEIEARKLRKDWILYCASPTQQPFASIRAYLGEKIALYFAWLGHYTIWLAYASVPGLIVYIYASIKEDTDGRVEGADSGLVAPFCAIIMLWSTFYIESWKRQNARIAMR